MCIADVARTKDALQRALQSMTADFSLPSPFQKKHMKVNSNEVASTNMRTDIGTICERTPKNTQKRQLTPKPHL